MFGFDSAEIAIVAVLALIFIGPKELPRVMRTVGYWVGRVRGMARHFTAGIEDMVREAELQELEKKWREDNERIMRSIRPDAHYPEPGQADEMPPVAEPRRRAVASVRREPAQDELPIEQRPLP